QGDFSCLHHVRESFEYHGYTESSVNDSNWDVLWSHDYPFKILYSKLKNLKAHQKVNHFPGIGHITNKMDLASSAIPYIPKAFKIPEQKEAFLAFASNNTHKKLIQKSNEHRGIKIVGVEEVNLSAAGSFVQEFIDDPLLVDGHKFDIGVYTVITSFDPLRVYIYNGEMLFRYCPEEYYPFDPDKVTSYVVENDYLPTWKVPSLKKYYVDLGYSMKDTFNSYMLEIGRKPDIIWKQIEDAIRTICLKKEPLITKLLTPYNSKKHFFEMIRFDFIVDNNLNVYVMEANMSPNLSSAHFPPNSSLYMEVLLNLFSLVGLANTRFVNFEKYITDKNIVVTPSECAKCSSCVLPECQLCLTCLTPESKLNLKDAYLEHINKRDFKRVFPPTKVYFIYENVITPIREKYQNPFDVIHLENLIMSIDFFVLDINSVFCCKLSICYFA
ncbi:hypothetical protein AAG570_012558, partial [Ranatra chinensis]